MSGRKIQTAKGLCIVDITKFLMEKKNCTDDVAYAQLMGMELYKLLMDTETGMYLEPNDYLFKCCEIEENKGVNALYDFIENPI